MRKMRSSSNALLAEGIQKSSSIAFFDIIKIVTERGLSWLR